MKLIRPENYTQPQDGILDQHCIWQGRLLDHHILCLASLFATQKNPRVTMWTDEASYPEMGRLQRIFSEYPFEVRVGHFEECNSQQMTMFRADKWRIQILKQQGGLQFDMDILFLKDISWFATQGKPIVCEGYSTENAFNNALLQFPAEHPDLIYWNKQIGTGDSGWSRVFQIQSTADPTWSADMIPNDVTDCCWDVNGFPTGEFFRKVGESPSRLDSQVVQHWHNRWDWSIHIPGTVVNYFWNKFVTENLNLKMER